MQGGQGGNLSDSRSSTPNSDDGLGDLDSEFDEQMFEANESNKSSDNDPASHNQQSPSSDKGGCFGGWGKI